MEVPVPISGSSSFVNFSVNGFLNTENCYTLRVFFPDMFQLHYDHQVLLDYLISKDTGTSCAEYLLRCVKIGALFYFRFCHYIWCRILMLFMEFLLE